MQPLGISGIIFGKLNNNKVPYLYSDSSNGLLWLRFYDQTDSINFIDVTNNLRKMSLSTSFRLELLYNSPYDCIAIIPYSINLYSIHVTLYSTRSVGIDDVEKCWVQSRSDGSSSIIATSNQKFTPGSAVYVMVSVIKV